MRPTDRPQVQHRLAGVLRLVDAFTGAPVGAGFEVDIPDRAWRAVPSAGDPSTHRFVVGRGEDIPTGTFTVRVRAAAGDYAQYEPLDLAMPPPSPLPPATPADYLAEHALWPTRQFRVPPAETAIVGIVRTAVGAAPGDRLRIDIAGAPISVPGPPYAYTDDGGEFLFRLPTLRGEETPSGDFPSTADLTVTATGSGGSVAIMPSVVTVPFGRVSTFEFTVP